MNWRSFAVLFVVLMLVFAVIPVRDGIADVSVESIRTLDVATGEIGRNGRPLFVDGEVLVKFNTRASQGQVASLSAAQGAQEVGVSRFSGVRRWRVPASKSVEEWVSFFDRYPLIEYAEPNYIAYLSMVPNDPGYYLQWHFDNPTYGGINLEAAWDLETGDSDVVVAVVDTGVAYEDFDGPGYWHIDTYRAYSGHSWWCGVSSAPSSWSDLYLGGSTAPGYGNGWKEYLQHSFDLTAATGSVDFSYRYRCHLENGYDFAYVEVSSNGGSDWVELTSYTGSGGPGGVKWRSDSLDLTGYAGSDVLVRFRVNSDDIWSDEDGEFNSDGAFFVDDIVLSDGSGVLFSDDAESGSGDWEISSYEMAPDLGGTAFWVNDDEILDNGLDDDGNGLVDDVGGWDFVNDDGHPNDDNGHGTHVSGTIAQTTNNGLGVAGIASGVTVMPVKVLNAAGTGTYQWIADGIIYAVNNGADIISMSLGGSATSSTLENAVAYAYNNGVTVFAASGNGGSDGVGDSSCDYPARYDDYVIAVGATQFDENRAIYSNYGSSLDIVAPGGNVTVDQNGDGYADGVLQQTFGDTTVDWGYWFYQGTSMATPHASGVAALLLSYNPYLTPSEIRNILESTAEDLGAAGRDNTYGWGLIDAEAALTYAPDPPLNIHLTWEDDTETAITVTWQTGISTSGDYVCYDVVSGDGVPAVYGYSISGSSHTYSGATGYVHDVELTGLTPDTEYYFICGGVGGWSGERAFRTAPSVSSDVRFVVGGDSRSDLVEREKISEAMAQFDPAFVMHSGDMVNDGRVQSQWDNWFTDVNDNWIGENSLTIPVIPVLGNHEYPNDSNSKYFDQFALPDNERWYSYDYGPDIHIICLDSESSASGDQLTWLENDLATHADYVWKFVIFHEPTFVSGGHTPWADGLTYWVPLFDEYHVNIVFNGHEHNYQRSYPLNWTASQTETQDYWNGTVYTVTGGWGAPLYTPTPIWYMAHQEEDYHFCLIEVFQNGTLYLQAKDNQGITFDEMKITPRPDADFSASPLLGDAPLTVSFTDQSTSVDGITSWLWDFGDTETSSEQNPTHEYDEGAYTVSLTVQEEDGDSDTKIKTDYVIVTVENAGPVINYVEVYGHPGGILEPAGSISPGGMVRIFTRITDAETAWDQLTVTISYMAQADSVWTSPTAQWNPEFSYWYYDWVIPEGATSGLYDIMVEASDGDGGSATVIKYGKFTVENTNIVYFLSLEVSDDDARWMDVARNVYSSDYQESYDYSQATVSIEYSTVSETFNGIFIAENLKPNFAYQLKLVGKPGTDSNELIGLVGRWWEQEWIVSSWNVGSNLNYKGDGSSPNPNDVIYFDNRDIEDKNSDTGFHYKYTGYLVFFYFVSDSNGNVELFFETGDCFHVLWNTTQRTHTAYDGPLKTVVFDPDISDPAYDVDYSSSEVTIFGEWERLPMGSVDLQSGQYDCKITLTEESFHGSGPLEGNWASVMNADISFIISG